MDVNDACNIEFLDLSDVDEQERHRVRTSLLYNDPSVQLPWLKSAPKKKPVTGKQPPSLTPSSPSIPHHADLHLPPPISNNNFILHPVVSPPLVNNTFTQVQNPAVTHVVVTPQIIQHPYVVCYTSPPTIQPTYPPSIFMSANAVHTFSPTPPAAYFQPQIAQQQPHQQHNGDGEEILHLSPHEEVEQNKDEEESVNVVNGGGEKSPVSSTTPVATQKSWASLFNSNNKATNGVLPGASPKPALTTEQIKEEGKEQICPIKHPRKSGQFVDPDCYRMGEFLSSYVIDGKATSLQPRGLLNQSNYCYINSILQALVACPPFYNLISGLAQNISSNEKRKPTPVIDGMCRLIKEFKHLPANLRVNRRSDGKNQKKDPNVLINTDAPFEPAWIYKMLNGIRTDLIEGRQEDAEEFLGCLLNGLNDEMLELMKLVKNELDESPTPPQHPAPLAALSNDSGDKEWQVMGPKNKCSVTRRTDFGRTPISDIFGGLLKSRIHRTGDHITENIQPFFTLQLNIEKVKTVREALEALTTKYQLEGLTSSKTNEEVEAWQQVMLDELPIILILHLKCFDFKLDGCTKIVKALEFPIDLKIETKLISSKTQTPKEKQYKLFAVVYHDGKEASKGHYVTDAFHVGYSSWLHYDDASVKTVQEEQVLKPQGTRVPYLLFYRRCDTIRSK